MFAEPLTRRRVLLVVAGGFLAACKGMSSGGECADVSALSESDKQLRFQTLEYADRSSDPARTCAGCIQFEEAGNCGKCQIIRGPISPGGRCKRWVTKTPA